MPFHSCIIAFSLLKPRSRRAFSMFRGNAVTSRDLPGSVPIPCVSTFFHVDILFDYSPRMAVRMLHTAVGCTIIPWTFQGNGGSLRPFPCCCLATHTPVGIPSQLNVLKYPADASSTELCMQVLLMTRGNPLQSSVKNNKNPT